MLSLTRTPVILRAVRSGTQYVRRIRQTATRGCQSNANYDDYFGIEYDIKDRAEEKFTVTSQRIAAPIMSFSQTSTKGQQQIDDDSEEWQPGSDKVIQTNFGTIRLDSMNEPRDSSEFQYPVTSPGVRSELGYIDEQYFSNLARAALAESQNENATGRDDEQSDDTTLTTSLDINSSSSCSFPSEEFQIEEREIMPKVSDNSLDQLNYFDELLLDPGSVTEPVGRNLRISVENSSERTEPRTNAGIDEEPATKPFVKAKNNISNKISTRTVSDEGVGKVREQNVDEEIISTDVRMGKQNRKTERPPSETETRQSSKTVKIQDEAKLDSNQDITGTAHCSRMFVKAKNNTSNKISTRTVSDEGVGKVRKQNVDEEIISTDVRMGKQNRKTERPPSETETRQSSKTVKIQDEAKLDLNQDITGTAHELSQKIRAEEDDTPSGLDSKGFINPKFQVSDSSKEPRRILLGLLKRSIIFNDHDILAIDKPYGLATQDGTSVENSLDSLLADFAHTIETGLTLHQVHRLDKNTTGVMVFAKSESMQRRLIDLFRKHKVSKRYWLLTKGVPMPTEGMVDIPLMETTVQGRYRMTVSPDDPLARSIGKKVSDLASRAVTKYKVLDSNNGVALVECQPVTGVKHQVRCHMAYALDCPVIGDHKYSHYSKIVPQKLYPETLQHLGIRQSKVRNLAMHLHSSSIYIPDVAEGINVFIRAKLPRYFEDNMKKLKIKVNRNK